MTSEKPLFRRIATSIQRGMAKSTVDNPDGPMAMYVWLWQSMGKWPGRTSIPRSIRFLFMASLDFISLGGWYVRILVLAVGLCLYPPVQVSGQDQVDAAVIGSWEGELNIPDGTQLTVVFNVERGEDGGLTGTLESPDQTDIPIPLSSATFVDGRLTLVVSSIQGSPMFTGVPSEDGTMLSGTFSQGGGQLPLELTKKN